MPKRTFGAVLLACCLCIASCGSSSPEAPLPATSVSESISESEALDKARSAAEAEGFSIDGLSATPAKVFGEWQVSFVDPDVGVGPGGFVVILDGATGDLVEVAPYR